MQCEPASDVSPHDECDAGPDEVVLDDERIQVGRALDQGVTQKVVVIL